MTNGNNAGVVNTSGNVNNNNANNGNFVAPDCAEVGQKGRHTMTEPRDKDTRSRHPSGTDRKSNGSDGNASRGGIPAGAAAVDPEGVIGYDALWESMEKCKRGVMWKDSVAHFVLNGAEEVAKLCDELHAGTYRPRKTRTFTISSPKRREIICISFRDRVFQRSLVDNCVYPIMSKGWIYDNAACQRGKGTDFARDRLKEHMRRAFRKHGADLHVLQIDVAGYYPSMRHDVVRQAFAKKLPSWAYEMVDRIIEDQYPGDVGFNPGSQLVQIAGISVLDPVDHFIKERLRYKQYVRYMDDMILISSDKQSLVDAKREIGEKLAELGFKYNERKTRIYHISRGIPFLGFTFRLSDTGRVTMKVKKKNLKAAKRRTVRFARLVRRGLRFREMADTCFGCYRSHIAKGDTPRLVKAMDEWYKDLWKETHGSQEST